MPHTLNEAVPSSLKQSSYRPAQQSRSSQGPIGGRQNVGSGGEAYELQRALANALGTWEAITHLEQHLPETVTIQPKRVRKAQGRVTERRRASLRVVADDDRWG